MTSRDRVLTAIAGREPDRVPIHLTLTPFLIERLREERGVEDCDDYFGADLRFAAYAAEPEANDFTPYTQHYPPNTAVDEWGCGAYPVGYFHFAKSVGPMGGFTSVEQVEAYPFPRREPVVEEMRRGVEAIRSRGLAAFSAYECGTFEQSHHLMGMEPLLLNMHLRPDLVRCLFERVSDVKRRMAVAHVQAGVDVLFIGDDIGLQRGPIMAPAMWRDFVLPHLRKIIAAARAVRPDIPIAYHSCGSVSFAVAGLIDAGIDILQSVQPEANDVAALKRDHGDRLSFMGGLGSQSTLSRGTPDDVRAAVKHLMATLGRGGGYICASAHAIEPESPLENLDAFSEAIEAYGWYGRCAPEGQRSGVA